MVRLLFCYLINQICSHLLPMFSLRPSDIVLLYSVNDARNTILLTVPMMDFVKSVFSM